MFSVLFTGETKECTEFAKQFLERRSKYKNQQRAANAHIDDMCSPAPAITPSNDFQEVKVRFGYFCLHLEPHSIQSEFNLWIARNRSGSTQTQILKIENGF